MTEEEKKKRAQSKRLNALKTTKASNKEPYIFISYKSDDWREALEDVAYTLQKKYGLRIYYDREFEYSNDGWVKLMQENMQSLYCVAVIAFFSEKYVNSYATLLEILTSQKENKKSTKEVIPVFLETANSLDVFEERAEFHYGIESTNIKKTEWDALKECINNFNLQANKATPDNVKMACEVISQIKASEQLKTDVVRSCFSKMQDTIADNYNQKGVGDSFYDSLYKTIRSVDEKVIEQKKYTIGEFKSVFDPYLISEDDFNISMTPMDSEKENAEQNLDVTVSNEVKEDATPIVVTEKETLVQQPQVSDKQLDTSQECDLFFQGAKAIQNENGITVLKGSLINAKTADSCPEKAKKLREEAIQNGELVLVGKDYQLKVDKIFKTTSGAATFVSGYSISGSVAWKSKTSTYTPKESKSDLKEMIQDEQIAIGAQVYVKGKQSDIGTVTENGTILYKGQNVSLNQYVLLVLGPGSRNAYQYVYEMNSGKTLKDLRDGEEDIEIEEEKKITPVKAQPVSLTLESTCDDSIAIGDIRKQFVDNLVAFSFRQVREGMPWGGKGAMDYAMAAILNGCNAINEDSPLYQINYYSYVVADADKKKEGGGLGATWTWSSNCRKVLGLDKAGQIPKEFDEYFKSLPETTTLREIEQAFIANEKEAYQTKKNEIVVEAIHRIFEFFKK